MPSVQSLLLQHDLCYGVSFDIYSIILHARLYMVISLICLVLWGWG